MQKKNVYSWLWDYGLVYEGDIEGAFFQIKMTPNQIRMTGYEEDAFLIFFFRFDLNSPI
jgi:hypothetical protein